jgi:hypothetical protein
MTRRPCREINVGADRRRATAKPRVSGIDRAGFEPADPRDGIRPLGCFRAWP